MDHLKVLQVIALTTLLVASATADIYYDRPCRTDVEAVQGFCVDRYLGKWYEMQRYEQDFQTNFDCVQAQYGLIDPSTVSVLNSAYSLVNETSTEAIGTAKLSFPEDDIVQGKLNVSFYGAPNDRSNYWVLDTDYENYSIVWSCEPLPEERSRESYWLLSRTRQFTEDEQINEKVNDLINKFIEREQVRITNQLDERCPSF